MGGRENEVTVGSGVMAVAKNKKTGRFSLSVRSSGKALVVRIT
jgi:hypothetical protein